MKKTNFSSHHFLWLALILLFPLVNVIWQPVAPNDYWWYLRVGGEIVETRAVPEVENFSFTQAGEPKINHSWLSSLLLWGLDAAGGINFTLLVAALTVALTYFILWRLMLSTGLDLRWTSLLLILLEIPSSANWALRPQLFTYPLFAASIYVLWHWEKDQRDHLWALPFLMLLWTNLHGSFILGFVLAGAVFLFGKGDRKKLFIILVLMGLASLINPRGIGAWQFVLFGTTNASVRQFVSEWLPPVNIGFRTNFFFAWYLFFMLLAGISSYRLSLFEWVWVLGFGWMGLATSRYDIWFLGILAPISASLVKGIVEEKGDALKKKENTAINAVIAIFLLLIPFLFLPSIRSVWLPEGSPTFSETTPLKAAEWLREHPELPNPIWADLAFESYLIYAIPERPVWIDPRFEVYPPEHWQAYLDVSTASWNWENILNENNINVLLLSKEEQVNLIAALENNAAWQQIYEDEISLIFTRVEK